MTFTNVGAAGWWPRRLDRPQGDPACDYKDGLDTWGGHCCMKQQATESTTLAPFDEEMTLILKAIDVAQLAIYQPSANVAACGGTGAGHPGPWVAFVASELVRDGGRKWNGLCNCYSKTGSVGDGCGEINVFEVVMDGNDDSNREFMSTGVRSFQAGHVGGAVCPASCSRDEFAADADVVDACARTAYAAGPELEVGGATGGTATGGGAGDNGWQLVWSDEFDGSAIDASRWEHEVNCWGGGNNEDQCYVADAKNSFVEAGALHIVALHDYPSGAVGGPGNDPAIVTKGHSSARLRTLNRGDFTYGRIEARLRLPYGQGLWPAFWMLPTDSVYGGWAASGEIDVMEAVNLAPGANLVYGTLHYGGAWPGNVHSGTSTSPATNAWEDFHVYAIEWEEGEIRWFVDATHFATQNEWSSSAAAYPAPFNERFHLLLNVAVGGAWPGPPDASTTFPQEMIVDYVRVYACGDDPVDIWERP